MKAALLMKPGVIELGEVEIPTPGVNDVLVQVMSCGVCATDVKKYTGDSKAPKLPFILGHEPAGVVVDAGAEVKTNLPAGTRVAIAPVFTCGGCYACRSGAIYSHGMGECSHYEVLGYSMDGAFAEYVVAPARHVHPLPEQLSFKDAALIEPVAACANGVQRINRTGPGTVVVLGAGFMGLVSIQLLKLLGNRVIAIDKMEERLQQALKLGAELALNPETCDVPAQVKEATSGRGANGVLAAVGGKALTETGLAMLGRSGALVLLASALPGTKFEVDLNKMHYDQTSITGSVSYTGPGYQWAIDLLSARQLDVETLVTHTGTLEKVTEFLQWTRDRVGLKKIIEFQQGAQV